MQSDFPPIGDPKNFASKSKAAAETPAAAFDAS
jgi:hypothetical protein